VVSYQKLRTLPKLSTRTRTMLQEVNIKIFMGISPTVFASRKIKIKIIYNGNR
jgi:hypothetical protein